MEIRTGKATPWYFTILGTGGSIAILLIWQEAWAVVPAAIFAIGGIAGISLLIRPKLMLRIMDDHLELYTGALLEGRRPKALIPLCHIQDYKLHKEHNGEGHVLFLSLCLKQDRNLPHKAERCMHYFTMGTPLTNEDPQTIHWMLWSTEGGMNAVQEKLEQHLRPAISP